MRFLVPALSAFLISTAIAQPTYEVVKDECTLEIKTPALAKLKKAKIRLSNGLEAYLISDPDVNQSCAALAIDAGSWDDPEQYPGMAHFLEHMLFMGTKAYPDVSEYKKYIIDHGGLWNAYTAATKTVYGFSINNNFLVEALDRFSHFFIDPLFIQKWVDGELKNVDQEYAKNLENDGWLTYMVLKETGNQKHPQSRFSTGNRETLSGIPDSALKAWYKEHYVANHMHLVVISPLPLDQMCNLVSTKFSAVPKADKVVQKQYPEDLFSEKQLGHWIYIKPVKDIKTLSMVWQLPKEFSFQDETGSANLLAYVLSNASDNSLYQELKKEKLIESLQASIDDYSPEVSLFSIDFALTEKGVKQCELIVKTTLQVLNQLKQRSIPSSIFEERKKIKTTFYEYQCRTDAFDTAMHTAGDLTLEPLETYPQKHVIASYYDAEKIKRLAHALSPQKCIYCVIVDPKYSGVNTLQKEKWMNAFYQIVPNSEEAWMAWSSLPPHPYIDNPPVNPYCPTDLVLKAEQSKSSAQPTLIVQNEQGTVYFLQDQTYGLPQTSVIFSIKMPEINGSAQKEILVDLYIKALKEKLAPNLFFAQSAGSSFNIGASSENALILSFTGYSEKLPVLIKTVFENLNSVSPTAAEFEIFKKSVSSNYYNFFKELPIIQGVTLLKTLMVNNNPSPSACLEALNKISYEDFLKFSHQLFSHTYVEGMIHGNLTQQEAQQIWNQYLSTLQPEPFAKTDHYKIAVLIPSEKEGPFAISKPTERQGNSALLTIYQAPFSLQDFAFQQILSSTLQDDFFDTLRTKQQTGYIASSWSSEIEDQLFQWFGVQSITHDSSELLARFELFIEDFSKELSEKVSPERFETLKQTLIEDLRMPAENLHSKTSELHTLAFKRKGDFEWKQKLIQSVEKLSYATFTQKTEAFLSRSNKRRIAILMHGVLPQQHQFRYEHITEEKMRDIGSYISSK